MFTPRRVQEHFSEHTGTDPDRGALNNAAATSGNKELAPVLLRRGESGNQGRWGTPGPGETLEMALLF